MNHKLESLLKKRWNSWRFALPALALIAVTPLIVLAIQSWLFGLRASAAEWKLVGAFSALLSGGGLACAGTVVAFRWLACWRNLRRSLLVLASLLTLLLAFYTEENWRGRRAWQLYAQQTAARGVALDLSALAPPPVPEDQNFCQCPLLKPLLELSREGGQVTWRDTNGLARIQALRPWLELSHDRSPLTNDLVAWQTYYRSLTNCADLALTNSPAQDVLRVLRRFEPELAELKREAARRARDRWPIDYQADSPLGILLPHLAHLKGLCSLLQLRERACLALGDTAGALSDFHLGFRLANSVHAEPFLISQLVRQACCELLLEPFKEGLRRHQLSEAQLVEFEQELRSADLLAGYRSGIAGERAFSGAFLTLNRRQYDELFQNMGAEVSQSFYFMSWFLSLAPRGWAYQNRVTFCRLCDQYFEPTVDLVARTVPPERTRALTNAFSQAKGPFSLSASVVYQMASRFGGLFTKADFLAHAQTQIDQARIAGALERYRLARGEYPETLQALVPQFFPQLPQDLSDGRPLHFHRTSADGFVLYSVGWNLIDDGGVTVWKSDGTVDLRDGDWAW